MSGFEGLLGISKESVLNDSAFPRKEEEVPTVQELFQAWKAVQEQLLVRLSLPGAGDASGEGSTEGAAFDALAQRVLSGYDGKIQDLAKTQAVQFPTLSNLHESLIEITRTLFESDASGFKTRAAKFSRDSLTLAINWEKCFGSDDLRLPPKSTPPSPVPCSALPPLRVLYDRGQMLVLRVGRANLLLRALLDSQPQTTLAPKPGEGAGCGCCSGHNHSNNESHSHRHDHHHHGHGHDHQHGETGGGTVGPAAPSGGVLVCGSCRKTDAKKKCSRCKQMWYCSEQCQRTHWPTHKKTCKPST